MTRRYLLTAALVALSLVAGVIAPTTAAAASLRRFTLASGSKLPYYGTTSLTSGAAVTDVVIVIHGTGRNAEGYFDAMVKAGEQADAMDHTAVFAPWFQTDDDDPKSGDAYWTNSGSRSWKDGGDAVKPSKTSSFDATDELIRALSDKTRFPNLARIVLTGHSAGGQFVQRYAAAGQPPATNIRYVTANPSSYLYLSSERPFSTSGCREYNDYKYGLDHLNRYVGRSTPQEIRDRYTSRPVTYLLGGDDVHHDHSIDLDCPAMAQGDNRLERGQSYFAAIQKAYPSAPHDRVVVPGVGHDHDAMYQSAQGREVVFGR